MAKRGDWVYDELLCFLGNPFFQVPVLTFMESKCLIFDPSIEDSEEYKKVYQEYKAVIQKLLDAFIKDTGISHDQVIKALQDMNKKKDIKEMFQSLFEQFFAAEDYGIFVRLMIQKNIELQQQALAMIMQMQGALPDSLSEGAPKAPSSSSPPAPSNEQYGAQNEEEILKAVLEQSKREYEEEQKKKKTMEEEEMKKEMESLIKISQVEHSRLEEEKSKEKTKLDQALFGMTLNESAPQTSVSSKPPAGNTKPPPAKPQTDLKSAPSISVTPAAPQSVAAPPKPAEPAVPTASVTAAIASQKLPQVGQQKPQMSSAEAAANWLKQTDDTPSQNKPSTSAVHAAAAAMSNMNPEELKKRQDFLKQQRDKLLEMKKKEREKQLLAAEKSQPKRPVSARMAKSAMEDGVSEKSNKLSPEEEKKMAMRKAIADRLKAEMLGK
ncbi:cilia- and flagella-associated protein 36-like [Saccostrea echinata]|uniref:cilia- and flagella-associated protein 36-like n=1 Tax=Saccostrea echinata TaxID=191078 RepID=UPI002A7EAC1C|nr:cilia- and flagella-associated protein 36-like [Saccostrea echinata]